MEKEDRKYGVDVVRIIAVILVLTVHFFLNTNYYSTSISGISMIVQTIIKNFCRSCVPLFIIITGFLNNKKEYNKSFFKGLFNILLVWLFYSIIEYLYVAISSDMLGKINIKTFLSSITSFKACEYSWYIKMYIGLYFMTPVLNNAYNSFNKKNKLYLLIITICNLILPVFVNNIFNGIIYMPYWWSGLYPIAYYIMGKFLSDNKPNIKKKNIVILIILTQILTCLYNTLFAIEYNSFTVFINSTLIFLLFYDIDIKNKVLQNIIKYTSNITLDIYLASSLIDKIIYPIFNNKFLELGITQQRAILYAPIILLIVFTLSFIYGSIRRLIINVR